jgi:hypothetical protein
LLTVPNKGGPLQASRETIEDAYAQWVAEGMPKNGKCGSGEGARSPARKREKCQERKKQRDDYWKSPFPMDPFPAVPVAPLVPTPEQMRQMANANAALGGAGVVIVIIIVFAGAFAAL